MKQSYPASKKNYPLFDMDHLQQFARVTRSNDGSVTVEVIDEKNELSIHQVCAIINHTLSEGKGQSKIR